MSQRFWPEFSHPTAVARGEAAFAGLTHPQLRPQASAIELARIAEPPQQSRNLFRNPPPALAGGGGRSPQGHAVWDRHLHLIA